jgi:hypothetical protein
MACERMAWLAVVSSLASCCLTRQQSAESLVVHSWQPQARRLPLGEPQTGDTRHPDARTGSSCKHSGRAGQALDQSYRFEVSEAGSYRFELRPEFTGVVQISQKSANDPWPFRIGCAASTRRSSRRHRPDPGARDV